MSAHSQIALRNHLISLMPGLAEAWQNHNFKAELKRWRAKGWGVPLPSLLKRFIIKAEALRIGADCLVETGTYLGDTPWFFRKDFRQIISIEVEPKLAVLAAARFRKWPNIAVIEGDSADVLQRVAPGAQGTTVFWLDGHYSSGITGKGAKECPILEELSAIFSRWPSPYSILIDDARLFGKDPEYPALPVLEDYMRTRCPDHQFSLENDVIFFRLPNKTSRPTAGRSQAGHNSRAGDRIPN